MVPQIFAVLLNAPLLNPLTKGILTLLVINMLKLKLTSLKCFKRDIGNSFKA